MHTVDQVVVAASPEDTFARALAVEQWTAILPHYRSVRLLEGTVDQGVVAMAANRPFGPLRWPTWWVSEMVTDRRRREIRYRHVGGITTGMRVLWRVTPHPHGAHILLTHDWSGPAWPLIGGLAAEWVIGPIFVHGIASRTLAGVARAAESRHG
jgi:ribosome-associated toxin RatA of RatAB toxin-antitoxin module